ncbi:MAG TPA: methyltransferase domain-containing protein [Crenalkalicoccus sp.]|nr:methyltransferase domain-containing protein [Crenalkalicoccus sp.]
MAEPEWLRANRASWDERVGVHLGPRGYDLSGLRAGDGRLNAIEEAELPPVRGRRVLHLQCHFGADSLTLAQRGAEVVGLDFSAPAIDAARALAGELGLSNRARFVQADVYDTPRAVPPPRGFDLVFVTWGALCWLPDIRRWAEIVAAMLRPGGSLYLADAHPAAYVFDDTRRSSDGMPGFFAPYFSREPVVTEEPGDYVDPEARLAGATDYNWIHPLGEVITGLIGSGLTLEWLREHDAIPWRMFEALVKDASGLYRWPDKPWLPLAFSLAASRR